MFLKKLVRVKKIDYICGNIQRTPKYTLKLQNTRFLCEYNAFTQDFHFTEIINFYFLQVFVSKKDLFFYYSQRKRNFKRY